MTSNGDGAGFWKFWTTLPGLITAIATLITALVAAGVISQRNNVPPPSSQTAPPRATSSSPPQVATSIEETPTGATAPEELWRGAVKFPIGTGLDLADGEARVRPEAEAREFVIAAGSLAGNVVPVFYHVGRVGKVEKRAVTWSDCHNALTWQPGAVYGRVNDSVCFESQDGSRLAAVSVLRWDRDSWATEVRIWQLKNR